MAGRLLGDRIAGREGVGDACVVRIAVVDAEGRQLFEERLLRPCEGDSVLRTARPRQARLHRREVELDDLRVVGLAVGRVVPEAVLLAVRLDELHAVVGPAGQAQILDRAPVHGEEAAGGAVLGGHVPDRRAVGQGERREAVAEVLDELPDHTHRAEDLRDREDEIRRCRALGQPAGELEADDLRHEHRDRLAQHRRLGLDPADTPAEHAEPVDHRRVRVGADERVREGLDASVDLAHLDDARQKLEVHLVDDARRRRDDGEVLERLLSPAQERVALAVALELDLGVAEQRERARVDVDLHRVVDDELGRELRIDAGRIAAEVAHRVTHGGEVDDRGHAREVLQQHAGRREADLARRLVGRAPAADSFRVLGAARPENVLEQDPQREREVRHVAEAPGRVVDAADGKRCRVSGHPSIQSKRGRCPAAGAYGARKVLLTVAFAVSPLAVSVATRRSFVPRLTDVGTVNTPWSRVGASTRKLFVVALCAPSTRVPARSFTRTLTCCTFAFSVSVSRNWRPDHWSWKDWATTEARIVSFAAAVNVFAFEPGVVSIEPTCQ